MTNKVYWFNKQDLSKSEAASPLKDGWGVTRNGNSSALVVSDGSDRLYWLDPSDLAVQRTVQVPHCILLIWLRLTCAYCQRRQRQALLARPQQHGRAAHRVVPPSAAAPCACESARGALKPVGSCSLSGASTPAPAAPALCMH